MSSILATFLLFTNAAPVPAAARTSGSESRDASPVTQVDLEVDASALREHQAGDAAEDSALFVLEDGARALTEQHGVGVVDDTGVPAIVVRLAWKDYESFVYRIEIAVRRPGTKEERVEVVEARCIDSTALSQAVVKLLPGALRRLQESEAEVVQDDGGSAAVPPPRVVPVVESASHDGHPKASLGMKGKAGIGLLAAGAAGVIVGVVVFGQGRRHDEGGVAESDWPGVDFRRPGVGVMAAGGAVAVTGAVLLVLDRAHVGRARRRGTPAAHLVPAARGFAITGRF